MVWPRSMAVSNHRYLSSRKARVKAGVREWKLHLPESNWCQETIGGICFTVNMMTSTVCQRWQWCVNANDDVSSLTAMYQHWQCQRWQRRRCVNADDVNDMSALTTPTPCRHQRYQNLQRHDVVNAIKIIDAMTSSTPSWLTPFLRWRHWCHINADVLKAMLTSSRCQLTWFGCCQHMKFCFLHILWQ
jgi:hypothetical protein